MKKDRPCAHDHWWVCTGLNKENRLVCSGCLALLIPRCQPRLFGPGPIMPEAVQDQVDRAIVEFLGQPAQHMEEA